MSDVSNAEANSDLRSQLTTQFDAAGWKEGQPPVDEGLPAPDAPNAGDKGAEAQAAPQAQPSYAPTISEQPRTPDGKFAPKSTAEAASEKAAPVEQPIPTTDQAKASETTASTPVDAPPAGWSDDAKAEWSKLPAAVKAAALTREAQMNAGGRQWSEEKRRYETMLSPVAAEASRWGLSAEEGIRRLLDGHLAIINDPVGTIRRIASNHGIDLTTLAGRSNAAADGSQDQTGLTPDLVRNAIAPMLSPIQNWIEQEQQQRATQYQREQASVTDLINQFRTEPGHEHFDAVVSEMSYFVQTYRAQHPEWTQRQVLDAAYAASVRANPDTFAAWNAMQAAQAETKRRQDAAAAAARARTAAVSVTGNPPTPNGDAGPRSIRDALEASFAAAR